MSLTYTKVARLVEMLAVSSISPRRSRSTRLVGVLAVSSALLACTGDMAGGPSGPAPGPAPPSLGVAKERLTGGDWKIVRSGDFNFDGMADVLWNDPVKNRMAIWLMSGTHLLLPGPVIPGPIGAGWGVAFAADFNFDGRADAIWQNTLTNRMAVWLMNGTHLLSPGPEIPGPADTGP